MAQNPNFKYVLTYNYGRTIDIYPEAHLNLLEYIENYLKEKNVNFNEFYWNQDTKLNIDDAVFIYNSMFNNNKDLIVGITQRYNEIHNTSFVPEKFKSVKLVTKEMANPYGLPFFHELENNRGSLVAPIIYKSDLDGIGADNAEYFSSEKFFASSFIGTDYNTLFYKLLHISGNINDVFKSQKIRDFSNEEINIFLKIVNTLVKRIRSGEGRDKKSVLIFKKDFDSTKQKYYPLFKAVENADIFDIMGDCCSSQNGRIVKQNLFKEYFPKGHIVYRIILSYMIVFNRIFTLLKGEIPINDIFIDKSAFEKFLTYAPSEIEKVFKQEWMNEEMQEIHDEVKDDLEEIQKEEKIEKDLEKRFGSNPSERELQEEINKYNAHEMRTLEDDEFDGLPFEMEKDETHDNDEPEDYYSYEDIMYNKEIRDALYPSKDDESSYSDYDERKEGNR